MSERRNFAFADRTTTVEIEQGSVFQPKFDDDGLIPAAVTDDRTGELLMLAWMNAEALALTLETRTAHFWSRSRAALWRKGEESGNRLQVLDVRTDCDQDAIWLRVRVDGEGVACHTGERSCFYRSVAVAGNGAPPILMRPAVR